MSLTTRINTALRALKQPSQPKPKHRTVQVEAVNDKTYFSDTNKRSYNKIKQYQNIYEQGGIMASAVDIYPEYMFMNVVDSGLELISDDQMAADIIHDNITKFNFLDASWHQVINSLVDGDGIAEIVPNTAGTFHSVAPRDSKFFDIQTDQYGTIKNYVQITDKLTKTGKKLDPSYIWHLKLLPKTGSPWGQSLIGRAIDEIMRDAKTAEGIADGIERHGTSKWKVTISTEDADVSDTDVERTADIFKNIKAKTEIVTRDDIGIDELDKHGFPVAEYNNTSIDRLTAALGVPGELLGVGRNSTEATSKVRMTAFERRIKSFQSRFNYQVWEQLFKPILINEGYKTDNPVYIRFGDIVPDDLESKASALSKLMHPIDPFVVMSRNQMLAQLGLPPEEEEVD